MKTIKDMTFGGERPLFESHDLRMENITISDGESAIKECTNLEADGCRFFGKYPWWHVDGSVITNCYFAPESRSAIWYSYNMTMRDCVIDGPKFFREMKNVELENVTINDADETFWNVENLKLKNVTLHDGTYPFMGCRNVEIDGPKFFREMKNVELENVTINDADETFWNVENLKLKNVTLHDGTYPFMGCRNAKITTKDSFWETEDITVYDSVLDGEYLGWHSKNLRLVRCHIAGEQPLCYAENLVLEDCTFDPACDRAFEYSTVQATISGHIENIKNPTSGHIVADSIGSITINENVLQPADCKIETRNKA